MGLFDLLKEEKVDEPQEEVKDAEVVEKEELPAKEPEKEVKEEPKKEVKKGTKKTAKSKKNNKEDAVKSEEDVKSLEEQIATVPDNLKTKIDVIYRYLMTVPGMDEKMRNPNKTVTDMFKYIENQARKQAVAGCAMIEDQEVFGWAVHYYDEENPE